jgi:type II secretory pathway pseudopilin PulG
MRMERPITPEMHGLVDYATVLMTAAAPSVLPMSDRAAKTCYALAAGYLGLSLLTDYRLSARRVVPFPAHGLAEGALGAALPMLPKALGFEEDDAGRGFLLGLTALTAVVAALTDWKGEETQRLPSAGDVRDSVSRAADRVRRTMRRGTEHAEEAELSPV